VNASLEANKKTLIMSDQADDDEPLLPLQLFERLQAAASIAQFVSCSSKKVESSMSTPCAMAKTVWP
jgi:hypothetical protein